MPRTGQMKDLENLQTVAENDTACINYQNKSVHDAAYLAGAISMIAAVVTQPNLCWLD